MSSSQFVYDVRDRNLDNSSCRVLVYLTKSGNWNDFILGKKVHKPDDARLIDIIQQGITQPDKNETEATNLLACKINAELANPGTCSEIGLILAAAAGNLETVERLEVELEKKDQILPLHDMAFVSTLGSHMSVLKFCLDRGVKVDRNIGYAASIALTAEVFEVMFPFGVFNATRSPRCLEKLLQDAVYKERSVDGPYTDQDGAAAAKFLLEKGGTIDISLLHSAARMQSPEFMKVLLSNGGRALVPSGELHVAALEGRVDMVRLLLDEGVDVNGEVECYLLKQDWQEWGPAYGYAIHYAVTRLHVDVVRLLVERGADPRLKFNDGPDALVMVGEGRGADGGKIVAEIRELLDQAIARFTSSNHVDE